MPEYAQDLTEYLERVGEERPTEVLDDPSLLQRALSKESPPALVGKVAEELEDVDNNPTIATLSDYERGRVMGALGRKQDALELYRQALASCKDVEIRGLILINLSYVVDDPTEAEKILGQAIEEGYDEALAHLGMHLDRRGDTEGAIQFLLESIRRGVGLGVPILGFIYAKNMKGHELKMALAELATFAQEAGIENSSAHFDEFFSRIPARSKETGRLVNLLAVTRPTREAEIRMMAFEKALKR